MPEILNQDAELEALRDQGREVLRRYLSAKGNDKNGIAEEIKRLPATVKAQMIDISEFKIFIRSFIVDALLGTVIFSKGQAKLIEMMLGNKMRLGINLNVNGGPISVEAEGIEE